MRRARPDALTASELQQLVGDIERIRLAEILATGATREEVEIALAWGAGASDVMGEERKPLAGRAARVFEILQPEPEPDEMERRGEPQEPE